MTHRLPVRPRPTLRSAALLTGALVLFGGGVYPGLRQRFDTTFDEQPRDQAALTLAPGGSGQRDGEFLPRLVGTDGRIVTESGVDRGEVPLDRSAVVAALADRTQRAPASGEENESRRIATVSVRRDDTDAVGGVRQLGLDRRGRSTRRWAGCSRSWRWPDRSSSSSPPAAGTCWPGGHSPRSRP